MTDMNTHDQLLDETAALMETVRRNIRAARELAMHEDMSPVRHDQVLRNVQSAELEIRAIAERRDGDADCPYCGGDGHIDDCECLCRSL